MDVVRLKSHRDFLRGYARYRKLASGGKTIELDTKSGSYIFVVVRKRQAPPRQAPRPIPKRFWAMMQVESPAFAPGEWECDQ